MKTNSVKSDKDVKDKKGKIKREDFDEDNDEVDEDDKINVVGLKKRVAKGSHEKALSKMKK